MQNHKFICLFLVLAMVLSLLTGCSQKNTNVTSPDIPRPEEVEYVQYEVTSGTFEKEVAAVGYFHFLNSEKVVLEENGAVLSEDITVKFGDYVEAGDVLATFTLPYDESDIKIKQLEYNQAQSEYESRISQYNSQIEAKRAQIASLSGTDQKIAELELESLQIDLQQYDRQQKAKLESLLENLEKMESKKEPLVLRAPMSGIIYDVPKVGKAGTDFSYGTALFTIYDVSIENMLLGCDTMDYTSLIYGMETHVYCTQNGLDFDTTGRVVASPYALTEETVAVSEGNDAYIQIDDEAALTRFIDFCLENEKSPTSLAITVRGIAIRMENACMLSMKAIHLYNNADENRNTYESALGWVYVLNENGTTSRRDILIGPSDGNTVCILTGLEAGDIVVNK